jgi:dihydrodipicolinate synthase/N-acetylneuraminate lyase
MNRDDVTWRGYWPACPTPFHRDGSYDPESHRALLELYLEMGVHGVLINGTTGEWFSQTADERRVVAETAIDIGAALASRLVEIDSVVALKDSTPSAAQFYETTRAVVDRVRVFGPYMSVEGFEQLLAHGGDGFIGCGCIFGVPDTQFWEAYWR